MSYTPPEGYTVEEFDVVIDRLIAATADLDALEELLDRDEELGGPIFTDDSRAALRGGIERAEAEDRVRGG